MSRMRKYLSQQNFLVLVESTKAKKIASNCKQTLSHREMRDGGVKIKKSERKLKKRTEASSEGEAKIWKLWLWCSFYFSRRESTDEAKRNFRIGHHRAWASIWKPYFCSSPLSPSSSPAALSSALWFNTRNIFSLLVNSSFSKASMCRESLKSFFASWKLF